jgi:hypothetical protein
MDWIANVSRQQFAQRDGVSLHLQSIVVRYSLDLIVD